ncbi:MAG: recombinase family protein, partial [Deltaproteobacteria bacterium]|nr:recombinase family protein [Deltaproteobacteria bacterium]
MSQKTRTPQALGYLRVGLEGQDLKRNRSVLLAFARQQGLKEINWLKEKVSNKVGWRDRDLAPAVASLEAGDWLLVPELFHLGRSTLDVLDLLAELKKREVNIYGAKGAWILDNRVAPDLFLTMVALFGEIDHSLVSARTTEALKARRAAGVRLGRPPGPGRSKLDPHRADIENLLRNGSKLNFIAKRYKVAVPTLINWIEKNNIDRTPRP